MATLPRGIKLYRKLRYRKGHGVHSPFVYNLITKIIEEKTPYYAFDEIEKVRQELLSHDNSLLATTTKEVQHRNYGALLFRLVNFFKCQYVLQIGSSTGIMGLYLAMASQNTCQCITLEEQTELIEASHAIAREKGLDNLSFMHGKYEDRLKEIFAVRSAIDLVFVNTKQDTLLTEKLVSVCLANIQGNTILVLDGISENKRMKHIWKKLKDDPKTGLSLDLHALGIVFFNERLHKQHYLTYFDYGKKQNLHKNRRQRFNFSRRRKKSPQNSSKN